MAKRYRPGGGSGNFVLYLIPPFAVTWFIVWLMRDVWHMF